ncbi:6-phosphofructokinase [Haliangium ochraceum]|uniref:Diphosphate--fructose-6-phosphate1-phosphotransf erase n=1 Tax=Haliangium ochraceum (strain DSM 14365 / JCM 11303 / SMP-2) TaxID=502025 RepID=D0LHZ0_HALO1|nr:6-phosphofructokinase [Haliangium ochraceum]ACY14819.1 Diphosphate--fructose-6-phosphate1-phosphotransf erase [Haliangium ochraceum DSM 14365]
MNTTPKRGDHIRRVGIIFAGGPAPAANAVISSAAISFIEDGREVVGFFHGYSNLQDYHPVSNRLLPDEHYRVFQERDLRGLRNSRGIIIGTARANPGKPIKGPADLDDPEKTSKLRNVYNALVDLEIDALISIGGDDTLKTANFLHEFQKRLPENARRVKVVHLPKTIDNDYRGIDFTFGFFTAVDVMAKEVQNLRADAMATHSYFVIETMGRKAGWLSYGVAIAGESNLVLATEDIVGDLAYEEEFTDAATGEKGRRQRVKLDALVDRVVDLILTRERRGKHYGTVVIAEGVGELLPESALAAMPRDEHGHLSLGRVDIGKLIAQKVSERYEQRVGQKKKVTGVQLGYESRCAQPHAFDVMLGSQLGIGAYRALVEENLDGHMVSATGQLDLRYVRFDELVNPETLKTEVRFIERGSDFHQLARFLETRVDRIDDWSPGRRPES